MDPQSNNNPQPQPQPSQDSQSLLQQNQLQESIQPPRSTYVPYSPQVPTSNLGGDKPAYKPKRKVKIFHVLMFLFVVIVAYGYFFVVSPNWAIPMALSKIDKTETPHVEVDLALTGLPMISDINFNMNADVDRREAGSVKLQTSIDASLSPYEISGELKVIDDTLYFRINKMPEYLMDYVDEYEEYAIGVWSSMKMDTIDMMSGDQNYFASTSEIFSKESQLRTNYEELLSAGVISKVSFKGIEKDGGTYVRVYNTNIDKTKLADYIINELKDVELGVEEGDIQYYRQYLDKILEGVDFRPIKITTSLLLGKLNSISSDIMYEIGKTESGGSMYVSKMSIEVRYAVNDPDFQINKPDGAISIDKIILDSYGKAELKAKDASIKARVSMVRAEAELYYDKGMSYVGLCKDTGTFQELITEIRESGSTVVCRDSAQRYIVSATLFDTTEYPKSYFCVDNTGIATQVEKIPATGFSCK